MSEAVATQVVGPMKCRGSTSATTNYAASQHPPPPPLSRPREDCEGCPVLAGVRNSGLDESQRRCSDLHCNFGVRSSRAASSGSARGAGSAQAGVYRPNCSSGRMAGACGVRGKVSAPCDSARLPTRCHAPCQPCQPCQAGRRSRPRLRRRQCPKRPVRQLQSLLRHTGERTRKSTLAAPRC